MVVITYLNELHYELTSQTAIIKIRNYQLISDKQHTLLRENTQ
jgi:hypothetical protein